MLLILKCTGIKQYHTCRIHLQIVMGKIPLFYPPNYFFNTCFKGKYTIATNAHWKSYIR